MESDNRPPFHSAEFFSKFAKEEGFHSHRVTSDHARTNGEAESFMKMLIETENIAHLQGKDSNIAMQDMLIVLVFAYNAYLACRAIQDMLIRLSINSSPCYQDYTLHSND